MQSDIKTNTADIRTMSKPQLRPSSIDEEIRNRRIIILYAIVFVVLAALPVLYFTAPLVPGETAIRTILPAATIYLFLGTLFSILLTTKLRFLYRYGYNPVVAYTTIVFVLVVAAIGVSSFVKSGLSFPTIIFYSCLFILPFTILQTWLYYKTVATPRKFKIWYLPPPESIVSVTVFLNSIPVKIHLSIIPGEPENVYEAVIPGRLTVGEMFSFFLKDKEETEGQQYPFGYILKSNYGWQFFTTSLAGLGMRQLDPDESLIDNGIKEKATIIIRRVQAQLPE